MANLTIRGIPDPLLQRLRWSAEENRRSLNGEVLYRLERSVESVAAEPDARLARIRKPRARAPLPPLTDELLEQALEDWNRPEEDAAWSHLQPERE